MLVCHAYWYVCMLVCHVCWYVMYVGVSCMLVCHVCWYVMYVGVSCMLVCHVCWCVMHTLAVDTLVAKQETPKERRRNAEGTPKMRGLYILPRPRTPLEKPVSRFFYKFRQRETINHLDCLLQ